MYALASSQSIHQPLPRTPLLIPRKGKKQTKTKKRFLKEEITLPCLGRATRIFLLQTFICRDKELLRVEPSLDGGGCFLVEVGCFLVEVSFLVEVECFLVVEVSFLVEVECFLVEVSFC